MSRKGLILFLTVGLVWGIPYLFIKIAVQDFTAPTIVFVRTLIGTMVLIPMAISRQALVPALRRWKTVLAFSVLELIGPWWLISTAENGHIDSGLAGLFISTVPFFGMALGYFYMGDKSAAHPKNIIGLVVGFSGIALLVGIDAVSANLQVLWVGAVILAAIGYALAPAVASKQAPEVEPVGIIALGMAFAAVVYVVPAALQPLQTGVEVPKLESWIALAVLGIICSSVAFVAFFELIKEVSYSRSTLITYMNTAIAVIAGVAFGSEPFTIGMAAGLPLVAVGSYLASRKY